MEKILKSLGFGNLTAEEMQTMLPVMIIGVVILLVVLILIFDRIENARFNAWLRRNSIYDTPVSPWRTIVPWHRAGSRWYETRVEGSSYYDGKSFTERAASADDTRLYNKIGKTTKVNTSSGRYYKK